MSADNCLVVGINGRFGAIFARKLAQGGAAVSGMDLQPAAAEPAVCGRYFSSSLAALDGAAERAVAEADCVVLCIPESAVLAALPRIGGAMRDDALLVDIASVKCRIHGVFTGLDTRIGYLSIHPMFGPMDDFSGRSVCLVPMRDSPRARQFAARIVRWGAHTTVLTAQEHDSATALVQALPHAALIAFGATLAASGVSLETMRTVATPIQKLMLALTARLVSGEPETYWSIQSANPHAAAARERLISQLQALSATIARGDAGGFGTTLESIRRYLGAFEGDLQQLAASSVAAAGD